MVGWLVGQPVRVVVERQPPRCGVGIVIAIALFVKTDRVITDLVRRTDGERLAAGTGEPPTHEITSERSYAASSVRVDRPNREVVDQEPRRRNRAQVENPGKDLAYSEENSPDD